VITLAFPNLPQATIISMHQVSLGVARASQRSPSRPVVSRTLKMTTQGPTRCQVLIPLTLAAAETVMANFFFFFLFINFLHSARSQSMADYLQQVAYSFRGLRGQKPPS